MKVSSVLFCSLFLLNICVILAPHTLAAEARIFPAKKAPASVYDIGVKDIDGKLVKLSKYKGKALILVNTASECGFTPQYKGLEKLYEQYKDQGLVILGFPSNDFGAQEPGTEKEIKKFCTLQYNIHFPMFAKLKVKGEDMHQLYKFLQETQPNVELRQEVKWNFNKFIVNRSGEVIKYFNSRVTPESAEMEAAIQQALQK